MAWRLVTKVTEGEVKAAVHVDTRDGTYRARLVAPRERVNHDADYFSDDAWDCEARAGRMVAFAISAIAEARTAASSK